MSDNTKVTIIVDGLGKQEITLDKKSATAIYIAASQGIIDKLITKDKPEHSCSCGGSCHSESNRGSREYADKPAMNTAETDPIQDIRREVIKGLNEETDKRIISELSDKPVMGCRLPPYNTSSIDMEEVTEGENINEFFDKPYPFTHEMFFKPLLVAYRCPDCGKVTVRYLTLGESNEARCHFCKETAIIEKVVPSDIKCTSCDTKNRPYLANGLTELHCVKCEAPIDIVYYKDGKKDRAKSANLI